MNFLVGVSILALLALLLVPIASGQNNFLRLLIVAAIFATSQVFRADSPPIALSVGAVVANLAVLLGGVIVIRKHHPDQ